MMLRKQYSEIWLLNEELDMSSWNVKVKIYIMIYTSVCWSFLGISKDIEAINGKENQIRRRKIGKILSLERRRIPTIWKRRFIGSCKCLDSKTLNKEQNSFWKNVDEILFQIYEKSDKSFLRK
jgi:hypothetical protein